MKNLFLIILFLILGLNLSTAVCYILLAIAFVGSLIYLFCTKSKISYRKEIDFIPFSFFLIWIYGIVIGFFNGNKSEYIIANFAGMFCYILYYFLVLFKVSVSSLVKILLVATISTSTIASVYYIFDIIGIDSSFLNNFLGEINQGSSTGQLRAYFTGLTVGFTIWVLSFMYLLIGKSEKNLFLFEGIKSRNYIWLFLLTTFILYFATASKGFMLSGVFYFLVLPVLLYGKKMVSGKMSPSFFLFIVFILLVIGVLVVFDYSNIVTKMFDSEDSSNALRYLQLTYIVDDITILGKGLGAIIPNFSRSDEAEYGFELSYINLIHKFGIFACVLFFNWAYVLFKASLNVYHRENVFNSSLSLGCMGYLFPSAGNPLLMHPACVILNCIALYLLRKK